MRKLVTLFATLLISHANAQLTLVETGGNSKVTVLEYPTLRLDGAHITGKYTLSDSKVAPTALTLTISGGNSTIIPISTSTPQPTPK